jgi:hypothetical protein
MELDCVVEVNGERIRLIRRKGTNYYRNGTPEELVEMIRDAI